MLCCVWCGEVAELVEQGLQRGVMVLVDGAAKPADDVGCVVVEVDDVGARSSGCRLRRMTLVGGLSSSTATCS